MDVEFAVRGRVGALAVAAYAAAFAGSCWALSGFEGFSLVEPLFVLGIMGVAMSLLAYALTRGSRESAARYDGPPTGLPAILAYLAVFAVAVLGFGFSAVYAAWDSESGRDVAKLALKLATMVAVPAFLLAAAGHPPRETLAWRWRWRRVGRAFIGMAVALLAFQAVFGRGLLTLGELKPAASTLAWAAPAALAWMTVEAGLCEEYLFRVALQTRLAAALRSETAAICFASLLFGLAHAPGLYLRGASLMEGAGAHPTLLWSAAYSIAIISPAGLLYGVLWSRTRSLGLVVLLHGLTDLLPNLAPFIQTWTR